MWTANPLRLLAPAAAALALAGCTDTPKPEAPAGVTLAGNWRLNHTASDDPQKVIGKMRAQAQKILQRAGATADTMGPRGGPGGRGDPGGSGGPGDAGGTGNAGGTQSNPALGADDTGGPHGPRRGDPLQYSPMMHTLAGVIARGDYLTVRQSSNEFVLDYGTTQRSYSPGAHSVVSTEMGVADQTSGWNGREYLIKVKAQLGANVVESYSLSADGAHLIDKVRIGPAELSAVELTRVYDRNTETAPRAPPTTG